MPFMYMIKNSNFKLISIGIYMRYKRELMVGKCCLSDPGRPSWNATSHKYCVATQMQCFVSAIHKKICIIKSLSGTYAYTLKHKTW